MASLKGGYFESFVGLFSYSLRSNDKLNKKGNLVPKLVLSSKPPVISLIQGMLKKMAFSLALPLE